MKNLVKMQVSSRGRNNRTTNMFNLHTCTTCRMNLVITIVLVMHGQVLQVAGDVIGRPRICVPGGIDRGGAHGSSNVTFFRHVVFIKPMPAVRGHVSTFKEDLADWAPVGVEARYVGVVLALLLLVGVVRALLLAVATALALAMSRIEAPMATHLLATIVPLLSVATSTPSCRVNR